MSCVFKTIVEPGLERIPVLEVSYIERHQGRDFMIVQTVERNVFTEFDRKLSRHLAATRGAGFPAFTVTVAVRETGSDGRPRRLSSSHHASVPHALKTIAESAVTQRGKATLTVHHNEPAAGDRGSGLQREITTDDVDALAAGLRICRHLGEAEFLAVSGDFDIMMAGPPGDLKPIVMHLKNGSVTMPCSTGTTITPFESPIHNFTSHAADNVLAQGYLAQARHALVEAKEAAVMEFRALAEQRIHSFDRALDGQPLIGHRLEAAAALVGRLKAGLGSSLTGLSEDAQITALDWSAEMSSESGSMAPRKPTPTAAQQIIAMPRAAAPV
jgi:hypothetical protein